MRVRLVVGGIAVCGLLTAFGMTARAAALWQMSRIQMVSQTRGWALARTPRGAVLLKTTDGGRRWRNVSPKGIWPLSPAQLQYNQDALGIEGEGIDMDFLSTQTGWVAVKKGPDQVVVERTRDGGRHWAEAHFPEHVGYELLLSFRDPEHGNILTISDMASGSTRKALYKTDNGGRTWAFVTEKVPDHIDPTGVTFRNSSEGWLTAGYHGSDELPFYRTDDGGRHWHLQDLDVPQLSQDGYGETYPPMFFGAGHRAGLLPVRIVSHAPDRDGLVLYRTRNAGRTWRFLKRLPKSLQGATAINFADPQTGWAWGENSSPSPELMMTHDGGGHWRTIYPARRKLH